MTLPIPVPAAGRSEVTATPRVIILLSTYNGAPFLSAQLQSFLIQTHTNWVLFWRDDDSTDDTVAIMDAFAKGDDRCIRVLEPAARVGATASFLSLLRTVSPTLEAGDLVAFSDQDDIWFPNKLERGVAGLAAASTEVPTLYCARQVLVDAGLHRIGESPRRRRAPVFPTSLTQNIGVGCTMMLNQRAVALIHDSVPPLPTFYDWWCYIMVTAAGGKCLCDDAGVILYRQHGGNAVSARRSPVRRWMGALQRRPAAFMQLLRAHVAALAARPELLSESARCDLSRLQAAVHGGPLQRLAVLRSGSLRRQTVTETALLYLWFLIHRAPRAAGTARSRT